MPVKTKTTGRAGRAAPRGERTAGRLLDVTMLLMRSISAHMRQSDRRLAPAQVGILARIGERPCTLSELAQHQAVRLPTISRSISMLADRGLVERSIPEHNRRQTMVRLTAAGRDALAGIKREAERHVDAVLADLSEGERAKVRAAIEVLSRALGAPSAAAPEPGRAPARSLAVKPARGAARGPREARERGSREARERGMKRGSGGARTKQERAW